MLQPAAQVWVVAKPIAQAVASFWRLSAVSAAEVAVALHGVLNGIARTASLGCGAGKGACTCMHAGLGRLRVRPRREAASRSLALALPPFLVLAGRCAAPAPRTRRASMPPRASLFLAAMGGAAQGLGAAKSQPRAGRAASAHAVVGSPEGHEGEGEDGGLHHGELGGGLLCRGEKDMRSAKSPSLL